jgi:hypothetical protein
MWQIERFTKSPSEQNALLLWGVVAIVAFQFMLGLYAVALNALFYAHYGPFFDSLSYDDVLANMELNAQSDGTVAALSGEIYRSTVVYPWVLFAPFARFAIASRAVGVWIQIFAAAWMQLAIFLYFLKVRGRTWAEAFAYSTVFVLIVAVFDSNGGLPDFRMDLLQYFLFTTVMANYLIVRRFRALGWWALLGLTTGLLCLGRATSPVYIVPIFGVCALVDLIADRKNHRQVLIRWLLAGSVAAVVAGWFFVSNYNYLHSYYFVWNPDANARLPLSESVVHHRFALDHVGTTLLVILTLTALLTYASFAREHGTVAERQLNWRPLLFSAVPLGYLVISGSGLNPFVSIVGVSGVMLFLLDPIDAAQTSLPRPISVLVVGALLVAGLLNAAAGIALNTRDVAAWIPRQDGIREVVQTITNAVAQSGQPRRFRYACLYTAELSQGGIFNTMFFDQHIPFIKGPTAIIAGSKLAAFGLTTDLSVGSPRVAGATDEELVDGIIQSAAKNVDFLVTSDSGTQMPTQVNINRLVTEINRRLMESREWEQVAGPITISPTEKAIVLRNRKRTGDSE